MTKSNYRCDCGCGGRTNLYRGKPRNFINGHQQRVNSPFKEDHKSGMTGKHHKMSTIKKIQETHNLLTQDEKYIENLSNSMKGNKNSVGHEVSREHRNILSKAMQGNTHGFSSGNTR